jgi:hypothetical protein
MAFLTEWKINRKESYPFPEFILGNNVDVIFSEELKFL